MYVYDAVIQELPVPRDGVGTQTYRASVRAPSKGSGECSCRKKLFFPSLENYNQITFKMIRK